MRWEDERYVRFYTRDGPEWLALSWHARGLFGLLLRAVDRAGILPVGKLGLKGAAVAVHAPWVEVEAPLSELLADGCLRFDEAQGRLLIPNFLDAQECPQSDKARKRASREKARATFGVQSSAAVEAARGVTKRDGMESQNVPEAVTKRDEKSHGVTPSHTESHGVTTCHPIPSRAVPGRAVPCREETGNSTEKNRNLRPAPVAKG